MPDGRIYITISDERGSAGGTGGTKSVNNTGKNTLPMWSDNNGGRKGSAPKGVDIVSEDVSKIAIATNFISNQAKAAASYTINNIGNFTGDYNSQRNWQAFASVVGSASGIVAASTVSPIAGAVAAASTVWNYAAQEFSNKKTIKRQNREIDVIRQISGMDALTNGSRINQ